MNKKLLYVQTFLIASGTIFAWTILIGKFSEFYALYGDFFRFKDCAMPNPLITPCFYGSVAFLIALIWSVKVLKTKSIKSESWLRWFLLFGVVFAFSVTTQEALHYYNVISGPKFACDPFLVHPLKTACFYGGLFYVASFIASLFVLKYRDTSQ